MCLKQKMLFDKSIKKIPINHPNNTRYKKYCVDCGILIMEYEYEFDGVEPYVGDLIFSIRNYYDFGGLRCEKCHEKLEEWIKEYYYEDTILEKN